MGGLSYFEAGILAAVYRGVNTLEGLKELFNTVDSKVVEEAVRRLEYRGYLRREKRGLLLKREHLALTQQGVAALDEAMKVLREAASRLREARDRGRLREELVGWEILSLAPLLLIMGLIPPSLAYGVVAAGEYGGYEGEEDYGDDGSYEEWGGEDVGFDPGDAGF